MRANCCDSCKHRLQEAACAVCHCTLTFNAIGLSGVLEERVLDSSYEKLPKCKVVCISHLIFKTMLQLSRNINNSRQKEKPAKCPH